MVRVAQGFLSLLVSVLAGILAISLVLNIYLAFFRSPGQIGIKAPLEFNSMCARMYEAQKAEASGTIYIRADGSIDPPTAPISTVDNVTYILTGNISTCAYADGIVVQRDNIVVDGSGFAVEGTTGGYSWHGVSLDERSNVTIQNTNIRVFQDGIWLNSSSNSRISGNTIMASSLDGIMLVSSSNNSISGNNIANGGHGMRLDFSLNNRISRNTITSSRSGMWLHWSSNDNNIGGNNITANELDGIALSSSSNNSISENNIIKNSAGISLVYQSGNNTVWGNYISENIVGIHVAFSSNHSRISGNTITNNRYGIYMWTSSGNKLYHNNFIINDKQISCYGSNLWDDGYPSGGNYWSDYNGTDLNSGPYQNETGSDGIGDTEYAIGGNNTDHYPLMGTFQSFNVSVWGQGPTRYEEVYLISSSTIRSVELWAWLTTENQYFKAGQRFLWLMKADDQEGTTGFCRVMIPNNILNVSDYLVVAGTPSGMTVLEAAKLPTSNTTHSYLYFPYVNPVYTIRITIPEFPPLLFPFTFMFITLFVAIILKRQTRKPGFYA